MNKFSVADIYTITEDDDVNTAIRKMSLSNIIYIATNLRGTHTHSMKNDNELELIHELFEFMIVKTGSIPSIAFHIFSIILRYMCDEKELFSSEKQGKKIVHTLFNSVMEKALLDSLAYADGLYQLVENSCLHSQSHCAYYSFRVYNTDRNAAQSELKHVGDTLVRLSHMYDGITNFNKANYYFEISCCDSTFDGHSQTGILSTYNDNHNVKLSSIRQLFNIEPQNIDDIIIHYGLRTLERIVLMNDGCFILQSYGDKNVESYLDQKINGETYISINKNGTYKRNLRYNNRNGVYGETNYKIIFPIFNYFANHNLGKPVEGNDVFELDSIEDELYPYCTRFDFINGFHSISEKRILVDRMCEYLLDQSFSTNRILCIEADNLKYFQIELLAKAIMKYSIIQSQKKNRLAILFSNKNYIGEFLRIYACFFDKAGRNYERFYVENTQIALCSIRNGVPEVNYILCGNNLDSANRTARMYSYHNPEASMEFIPLTKYLTNIEKTLKDAKVIPTFPFDLYLDWQSFEIPYNNEKTCLDYNFIWFNRRINNILGTSIQEKSYGCKVESVNISIGSKIHIDTFYNAELLFHNYGNIWRFAYMVAKDILAEHQGKTDKIILFSYENYSHLLNQQICYMIEAVRKNITCQNIVFSSRYDEDDSIKSGGLWPEFKKLIGNLGDEIKEYTSYIVFPIGTTLTTVYKIQNVAKRICKVENRNLRIKFGKSFTLILVGGVDNDEGVKFGYWESIDSKAQRIEISCDKNNTSAVKYYFNPKARWLHPQDNDRADRCLISVDKTQTLPNAIFESFNSLKSDFDNNFGTKSIEGFYDCINYAHISDSTNHYQYNIDYKKYFYKNETEISRWLRTKVRPKIFADVFNIIVSPLNLSGSEFLKSVIDNAFESSTRLFNININTSYKEDIRAKFSYITQEYKRMKVLMGNPVVNIYYVDTCIVTGATFYRGRQFIQMLLNDFVDETNVTLFKGIILLTNRSSCETISNLLCTDNTENFFAYVNLKVPSYNTINGFCPSCELETQYQLMHKRASTMLIAEEYKRLSNKHKCRDLSGYENWLNDHIIIEKSYLNWFFQWWYYQRNFIAKRRYVGVNGKAINMDADHFDKSDISVIENANKSGKNYFNPKTLKKDEKKSWSKIVRKTIISDRDFMRLSCTHDVFNRIDRVMCNCSSMQEAEEKTRKEILNAINQKFKTLDEFKNSLDSQMISWMKAEWLLSYIKIISRKQTAKYYHIKQAIYSILTDVANALLSRPVKEDICFIYDFCNVNNGNNVENSAMPEMKWKVFLAIIRRLSAMHSQIVIDNVDGIEQFYMKCKNQYKGNGDFYHFYNSDHARDEYHNYVKFPSNKEFIFDIAKLIKWTAMSNYDESKSFRVEQETYKNICCDERNMSSKLVQSIWTLAFLENVQIIYNGLNRLDEAYLDENCNASYDDTHEEHIRAVDYIRTTLADLIKRKDAKTSRDRYYSINPHKYFFEFMDHRKHYTERYDSIIIDKFGYMLSLFRTLKNLAYSNIVVDNPYKYEKICNLMANIAEYDQCKIICSYQTENYIIAGSSICEKYFHADLCVDDFENFIKKFIETCRDDEYGIKKIVQKFEFVCNGKLNTVLLLPIPIEDNENPTLYIALYSIRNDDGTIVDNNNLICKELSCKEFWDIRNILFIRDKIENVLHRDMIILKDMIHRFNYILPLGNQTTIMHISDLHINTSNFDDSCEALKNLSISDKPDLLLITGDVVNGAYNAKKLIENYEKAENFIRKIAFIGVVPRRLMESTKK